MILARALLLLTLTVSCSLSVAYELSGRFSMVGATAQAEEGDWGNQGDDHTLLTADQQGLRLMLEGGESHSEWSAHLRTVRIHTDGFVQLGGHSSELFRYSELADELLDESDANSSTQLRYELDRLYYRRDFSKTSLTIGRQAIDWGSGRFWQPLNLFGSFSPTDLDTDYKPGIDALSMDYYPSAFSSLTGIYAFSPEDNDELSDSGAIHYRRQVGESSEMMLVAGSILGNTVMGAAIDSDWKGMGWRVEGSYYQLTELDNVSDDSPIFWVAGVDYQFDNGIVLTAEYYHNQRGATEESELAQFNDDLLMAYGLQKHFSQHLFGLALNRDITPLLNGNYTLLASPLEEDGGAFSWSFLHQLNLIYSVSNESDFLISLLLPNGKGLSDADEVRSEFGHQPQSLSMRLRFYF